MSEIQDFTKKFTQLYDYFTGIKNSLNQTKEDLIARVAAAIDGFGTSYPVVRKTINQYGNIESDSLKGWYKNGSYNVSISVYRVIHPAVNWSDRDTEEKEILTAMGMHGAKHFRPAIQVIKAVWSGKNANYQDGDGYLFYPPSFLIGRAITFGCYAKLNSGSARGFFFGENSNGLRVNNEWNLCGYHMPHGNAGSYTHGHPYASSDSGEILFIWPAVVDGHVVLDRANPKWAYYNHPSATQSIDTSI